VPARILGAEQELAAGDRACLATGTVLAAQLPVADGVPALVATIGPSPD
jgi:hypothetical protein